MYGKFNRTQGRRPATPNDSQICFVASVYKANFLSLRLICAMHVAVGAAFNVVYLDCLSRASSLDLKTVDIIDELPATVQPGKLRSPR